MSTPKELRKRWHLKCIYNLTPLQYAAILDSQFGRCAICGCFPDASAYHTLFVDHDHRTGKIRGLLCDRCNKALGFLRDDPSVVEAAKQYLLKPR